ncbi:LysE family translocator [Marinimicrobium agarilyticum]|uniref:LysE family translocator n=1 Tax=Marinimicrobium agarilyticum TaxID=306546 RepID=UPI00040C5488|nr:LysE family translocator [Marinimicrobium agarilyticum]
MHSELVLSTASFVLVMVGSPGPNNLMLMASGVNFGVRRSIPHMVGIILGCQVLLLAMAIGLGELLVTYPQAALVLKAVSVLFLIYVALLLWQAGALSTQKNVRARPMSVWEAAVFQWVNPKAWMMCLTMVAALGQSSLRDGSLASVALTFALLSVPLLALWNAGGQVLNIWLQKGSRLLWFNRVMALLLLGSVGLVIR